MRTIAVKYEGDCRKCGNHLSIGQSAVYERRVGIFCPTCAPTDTEEIREYRQEGADKKADRLDGWADARIEKANATLAHNRKHYTSDIAFNTQPGHIPLRARVIAQNHRAYESLKKANDMAGRASSLRCVSVKGDKERERQQKRDAIKPLLQKGMTVFCAIWGKGIVQKVNQKTATVHFREGFPAHPVDLSWLKIVPNSLLEQGAGE